MTRLTTHFEALFKANPDATFASNYAGAVLRNRNTFLTTLCNSILPALVENSIKQLHEYRMHRAQLNYDAALANYATAGARASAQDRKLFIDSIDLCKAEFKDDANRQTACLEQIIPIKSATQNQRASANQKATNSTAVLAPKAVK